MDVIICGGREAKMHQVLRAIKTSPFCRQITRVLSGKNKKGGDKWGEWWANFHGLPVLPFPVDWHDYTGVAVPRYDEYGRMYNAAAGPNRNQKMVDFVSKTKGGVIAAWDGVSSGTCDTITRAIQARLPHIHIWVYSCTVRNMVFALTTKQMLLESKDVTRRVGWWHLKPGDHVRAVDKRGELLATLVVTSSRWEQLDTITKLDVVREGFPLMNTIEFIEFYCRTHHCTPETIVNRIEYSFLKGEGNERRGK